MQNIIVAKLFAPVRERTGHYDVFGTHEPIYKETPNRFAIQVAKMMLGREGRGRVKLDEIPAIEKPKFTTRGEGTCYHTADETTREFIANQIVDVCHKQKHSTFEDFQKLSSPLLKALHRRRQRAAFRRAKFIKGILGLAPL